MVRKMTLITKSVTMVYKMKLFMFVEIFTSYLFIRVVN